MERNNARRPSALVTITAVLIVLVIITLMGACGVGRKSPGTPIIHRSGDLATDPTSAAIGQTITLHGTNWPAERVSVGVFVENAPYLNDFARAYASHGYATVASVNANVAFSLTYELPSSLKYGNGVSVTITPGMKLDFFTNEPLSAHLGPAVSVVAGK